MEIFNNKKILRKKYDKVEVLRNINMHVTEGEIYWSDWEKWCWKDYIDESNFRSDRYCRWRN